MTTITLKTNEELQLKIDTFFKNCGEGYETFGCISRWNVFAIKQIDVVFPRKYCCMTDGFKIKNWVCQKEPKIRYYSDFCYCNWNCYCYQERVLEHLIAQSKILLYSRLEALSLRDYRQTRYIHNHHNNMSTVSVGKIGETPQLNDKNIRTQRDRITRYVNKTSPKIKSSNMQIGKR